MGIEPELPMIHNFNSHAHEGRDIFLSGFFHIIINFNSHAHEGRDVFMFTSHPFHNDFNSHAHEGRDFLTYLQHVRDIISTHTPTRGVTCESLLSRYPQDHFNSHAHEGRDMIYFSSSRILLVFQLTRPRGA